MDGRECDDCVASAGDDVVHVEEIDPNVAYFRLVDCAVASLSKLSKLKA